MSRETIIIFSGEPDSFIDLSGFLIFIIISVTCISCFFLCLGSLIVFLCFHGLRTKIFGIFLLISSGVGNG